MEVILEGDELEEYRALIPPMPWLGFQHQTSASLDSFEDYPLQYGWSRDDVLKLKQGNIRNLSKSKLVLMLQSWFSLGLIECAFGLSLLIESSPRRGRNTW
jgi:hypothetical protein